MVGTIRPLRFLQRQKSLLTNFVRRHRKALLIVGIIAASYFTVNIASAMAFNQKTEVDGVRVETDRTVYFFGDRVETRLYLVNNQGSAISICSTGYVVTTKSLISGRGWVLLVEAAISSESCEVLLRPHSEMFWDSFWFFAGDTDPGIIVPTPGVYTIEVTVTTSDPDVRLTGKTTILVTMAGEL